MCIDWFAFEGSAPPDAVLRQTIARFYPVEVEDIKAERSEGERAIVTVVFWAGTMFPVNYLGAAMESLGGWKVNREGKPRETSVPAFARRPWADYSFFDRFRLRVGSLFGVRS